MIGAKIKAESDEQAGTRFTVTFDLAPVEDAKKDKAL